MKDAAKFCPQHTEEIAGEYAAAKQYLGHDLSTIKDLQTFLTLGTLTNGIGMNYNLWVQRTSSYGIKRLEPTFTAAGTDPAIYGWPQKTTDRASAHVPFMSDECFSGFDGTRGGTNVSNINITAAGNG